ncbi:alanine--tRNA ligase, partial [Candidatus Pyrohabitans sp.]
MVDEKRMKAEFRRRAQAEPERYYPVQTLISEGFERRQCKSCGNYFWSASQREVCGEPSCSGGYTFIGDTPAREKMDFIQTWRKFSRLFKKLGYTPIKRYPIAARWRDDTDFVQASIYDFQPYVVKGEVEPPANPLVVPQFCVRFNDIDNVGITGRHYTGFVMIGQHAFEPPESYAPEEYLHHIYLWLTQGMKIPKEEIQFHEDAWAGGGNLGPSIEFFSRGLEIGNQVYMQYDITSGELRELSIKVLDMGMGQERPAWFTCATNTSYEAVFADVVEKLYARTGIKPDHELMRRFLPYSGLLNVDERSSIEETWQEIAGRIGVDVEELKDKVLPLAALYSIGDHARSLLVALTDGALPSNVGGGYNLRVLVRRSLDFIAKYGWSLSLAEVCEWHAQYLKPQYPELVEHLDEVAKILAVEERKYAETKRRSREIVAKLRDREIGVEKLLELYDSHGISPEMLAEVGLEVEVPEDFYIRLAARHERSVAVAQTKRFKEFDISGLPATEILYYDDYLRLEFEARVLRVYEGKYVVLDSTAFYPTSGGQIADRGYLDDARVVDVFKQGSIIFHRISGEAPEEGSVVRGRIDAERRVQLAQHHTATHIINGVARRLLGEHVWQAGAEKTLEKARLDITHYESLSSEELSQIEELANEVVARAIPVKSMLLPRNEAEKRYGFRLYQGGAVPGKVIRVVKIGDLDTEACGGTHLKNTREARLIKVIGSTKIQDGVVRIEFTAGRAAFEYIREREHLLRLASEKLSVNPEQLPETVEKFFREWKALRKEVEKLRREMAELKKAELEKQVVSTARGEYLVARLDAAMEETIKTAQALVSPRRAVVLFGVADKIYVAGIRGEKLELDISKIVREVCSILGGGGGGRAEFAQGAGKNKERL